MILAWFCPGTGPVRCWRISDGIRLTGEQAGAYAEQNRATELEYYDIVCAPNLGPIP